MENKYPLPAITTLTRQFLNCWLGYVLSQPVDIDISIMLRFLKSYFGLQALASALTEETTNVTGQFISEEARATFNDLVSQESYS